MPASNPLAPDDSEWRRTKEHASATASWRWVGWFGLVFTLMGLGDIALAWYPPMFGSAQWEFGTVAATFQGLPLLAIGFAAMLAGGLALRKRWLVATMGAVLVLAALGLLAALVLFATDVPIALQATRGAAKLAAKKAIAKTTLLGLGFGTLFFVAGLGALRARRREAA